MGLLLFCQKEKRGHDVAILWTLLPTPPTPVWKAPSLRHHRQVLLARPTESRMGEGNTTRSHLRRRTCLLYPGPTLWRWHLRCTAEVSRPPDAYPLQVNVPQQSSFHQLPCFWYQRFRRPDVLLRVRPGCWKSISTSHPRDSFRSRKQQHGLSYPMGRQLYPGRGRGMLQAPAGSRSAGHSKMLAESGKQGANRLAHTITRETLGLDSNVIASKAINRRYMTG